MKEYSHKYNNLITWFSSPDSGVSVDCEKYNFTGLNREEIADKIYESIKSIHNSHKRLFINYLQKLKRGDVREFSLICRVAINENYFKKCVVGVKRFEGMDFWSGYIVNIDDSSLNEKNDIHREKYSSLLHELCTPISTIDMNLMLLNSKNRLLELDSQEKLDKILKRMERSISKIKEILEEGA